MSNIPSNGNDLQGCLSSKNVLITGASSGIGLAILEKLIPYPANICAHYYKNRGNLIQTCRKVSGKGKIAIIQANLLTEKGRAKLVNAYEKDFERIDVLVNNAGSIFGSNSIEGLDVDSWRKTFQLNCEAPFFLSRWAFGRMKRQGGGKIINISSISAKYGGGAKTIHYGASKAALDSTTIGLARLGAPFNILVNSIRPGIVDTGFHRNIPDKDMKERINMVPLKRMGSPEEVASLVVYLISDNANYITGEIISIAGGD